MNDKLAERLLAKIMEWDEIRLAKERKDLQALASLKYDEYQQFFPGSRFIETLSLWLKQFSTITERELAYGFVKRRIIFISNAELNHLIRMAYPDVIEPYLVEEFAKVHSQINKNHIAKIANSNEFKIFRRQCLFLGLSDGARIDILRRYSRLNHEQVYPIYSYSNEKASEFITKLTTYLTSKNIKEDSVSRYKIAFLIDDFSGSGTSFIRKEDGSFDGKIPRFLKHLEKIPENSRPFDVSKLKICVLLYMATSKAQQQIEGKGKEMLEPLGIEFTVRLVHELSDSITMNEGNMDSQFYAMLKKYYDDRIESESYKKGKMDNPHLGFDEGGLPLILSHNCPNNSIPLLWFDPERYKHKGLFPRVERFPGE